jgi:hypothetical protein
MTTTTVKHEPINEIVSSFADQLATLFPCGFSDDEDFKIKLSAVLKNNQKEEALPLALEKWKASKPKLETTKPKPKSFSLLDQFSGGFKPPVTLDEILESGSATERVTVFKKITYLDDIIMDWLSIKPLLFEDLLKEEIKYEILEVHRKLYDQGRCSSEYLILQYDLKENILNAIISHIQRSSIDYKFLFLLMKNWSDLFLDIMQRDLYSVDLVEATEARMLFLLRDMDPSISLNDFSISPAAILALVDSGARWFRCWIQFVSQDTLISLLEQTSLLPDIVKRSSFGMDYPDVASSALSKQAVTILACILEKTRVCSFPWHLFTSPKATPLNPSEIESLRTKTDRSAHEQASNPTLPISQNVDQMLEIFLPAISLDDSLEWSLLCCYTLEILLLGCKNTEYFDRSLKLVIDHMDNVSQDTREIWISSFRRLQ